MPIGTGFSRCRGRIFELHDISVARAALKICRANRRNWEYDSDRGNRWLDMLNQENETSRLETIAARVCWWEPAQETLKDTPLFLCRVMTWGTWDDVSFCLERFGEEAFRNALRSAPPGLLDPRSWHYWHNRLGMLPVPEMPVRAIPA